MRFQVTLTPDEDGWIVAEVPALPGCITQGNTREEALLNVKDAIEGWLQVRLMRLTGNAGKVTEPQTESVEVEV
jgi:predicted RNase H-like HicB family nuclease